MSHSLFLPVSQDDVRSRGWDCLDIIIISGDAYVDHHSFGTAVIGRYLEKHGFKVGVIPQPDWRDPAQFLKLGKPRLFFAVTSGNMDSLVCNRTSANKPRRTDMFSPGGKAGMRPDRSIIVYTSMIKNIAKGVPVVIGGIEASLRRLAHYDYWSNSVRRSILLDSKADILVYGMGEKPVLEIARRLNSGEPDLSGIEGTCIMSKEAPSDAVSLPDFEIVRDDKKAYMKAHKQFVDYFLQRPDYPIFQKYQNRWLVHAPPGPPLTTQEMDEIYALPFKRRPHPMYDSLGGIPAFEAVKFSVTAHRGCFGGCSFCALFFHQGHIIQSRSKESILAELRQYVNDPDFKGTVSDIGGPTANMYGLGCKYHEKGTHCGKSTCLGDSPCPALNRDHSKYMDILASARSIKGISHVFVSSGLRYDIIPESDAYKILTELCTHHISGQLKVAPEHISPNVLRLMNKPGKSKFVQFQNLFSQINKKLKKKQYIIPYFIVSHPGCTEEDMLQLQRFLTGQGFIPDQIQDFLPTPMTTSTCMYYTELDLFTETTIFVPKSVHDRTRQRTILHGYKKSIRHAPDKQKEPAGKRHRSSRKR
ncbi:MAG: YgiQ family radical SAM protein [Candidatus Auribacter fodinae]|jgi:uncharacterized radical SAM protein YgiQ|uniref:YgiQ family radical SAM protein n=1 Tax=Candidatus Auribacter fodinae TaxID=2093366 RepID=A0A3A4QYZ6_9BACT|nr:MAG: YgiQ family radical SAM protein [Candidatus Auribacter fodinae]